MERTIDLTVLCDGTAAIPGLGTEWGLSVHLRLDDGSIWLWDFGQTGLFAENARRLGLNLSHISGAALSHGHYDHSGGLGALFGELGYEGVVHAHPGCLEDHWKVLPDAPARMIGMAPDLRKALAPRLKPVKAWAEPAPGLVMFSGIPRRPGLGQGIDNFFLAPDGKDPDPIPDDAFLCLETKQGWVALFGCCHAGVANSLYLARDVLGVDRFHAVIGGLHLAVATPERLRETATVLDKFRVEEVHAGHCTGQAAMKYLKERLPGRVHELGSGAVIRFPAGQAPA